MSVDNEMFVMTVNLKFYLSDCWEMLVGVEYACFYTKDECTYVCMMSIYAYL